MKKKFQLFSPLFGAALLAGALSWGTSLYAQDTSQAQPQQPQSQPSQAPDSSGQAMPSQSAPTQSPNQTAPAQQSPDAQAQSSTGVQTFTGTIIKSGDKYVLQDAASGTTYDLDHQDELAKFEGKRVRVHGTVDATGKMIHVQ
jgi:cytoskeletal protein RodZ